MSGSYDTRGLASPDGMGRTMAEWADHDTPIADEMFVETLRQAVRLRVDAWVADADTQQLMLLLKVILQPR